MNTITAHDTVTITDTNHAHHGQTGVVLWIGKESAVVSLNSGGQQFTLPVESIALIQFDAPAAPVRRIKAASAGTALFLKRIRRVNAYANPWQSTAYENDTEGHGWDRFAAIRGEYARGEIDWRTARAYLDENATDLAALAAA